MHVHSSDLLELRAISFEPKNKRALCEKAWGIFRNDPNAAILTELVDYLLLRDQSESPMIQGDGAELLLSENLQRIVLCTSAHPYTLNHRRSIICASERYDLLGSSKDHEWNLVKTLNFLALGAIRPTKRVAVLASARDEGLSLLEWVSFYRALGFDSIFIYANDNVDCSERLLRLLADYGIITLIENDTCLQQNLQQKVFNHALSFVPELWEHEWLFFADLDEFLIPRHNVPTISALLDSAEQRHPDQSVSGICFNWKWFGSDSQLQRGRGLLLERFQHSSPSRHVKTIARLRDVTGIRTAHLPRLIHGGHLIDGGYSLFENPMNEVGPTYTNGQINHYWNKSFEEFLVKRNRGRAGMVQEMRDYAKFFEWGNMRKGDFDPVPGWLMERVQEELGKLLKLPYIERAAHNTERAFENILHKATAEIDIRKLYDDTLRSVNQVSMQPKHVG